MYYLRSLWRRLRRSVLGEDFTVIHGVRVPLAWIPTSIALWKMDRGSYESAESRFARRWIPEGATILELGASLGIVSSVLLSGRPRRLVSVEALERLSTIARKVVALNHPGAPWHLVIGAIAYGRPTVTFQLDPEDTMAGAVIATGSTGSGSTVEIPAVRVGDLLREHGIGEGFWLVCDIEGAELEVAREDGGALRQAAGVILELHAVGTAGIEDVLKAWLDLGFHVVDRKRSVVVLTRDPA